jgi:hypothetical protein
MASALVVQGLTFPARRRRPSRQAIVGDEPEASFMRRVMQYLRLRGWDLIYHVWDATNSEAGFPDIIALRDGRGLALECKSQHGHVRASQRSWVLAFDAVPGFDAAIVRPSDWAWIVRVAA